MYKLYGELLKQNPKMLGSDSEHPAGHPKAKILTFVLENRKKFHRKTYFPSLQSFAQDCRR